MDNSDWLAREKGGKKAKSTDFFVNITYCVTVKFVVRIYCYFLIQINSSNSIQVLLIRVKKINAVASITSDKTFKMFLFVLKHVL